MDDSRQLALVLFDTLAPQGRSVVDSPTALGFRRSNAFVRIVDLSLASRRLIDVAYFLVAAEPELQKEYHVDFGLFKWLLGTTSENRVHIKKLIREAQKAAIELNGPDVQDDNAQPWGSVPLMGPAFIAGGEFIFELTERLQKAIKNPEATHFLSLRYVFKSLYSRILYDRLQPFIDEGITPWFDLDALRVWLECDKQQTYNLFKHFRNKVLDVAVNEIREVTGLKLEMVTQNVPGSKKIGHVRFKWDSSQHSAEQKTAFVVLKDIYETLRNEFALNQNEFDEIIKNRAEYTDDRIKQAMDYTRQKAAAGKIKLRAGGYFMKSLREGYLIGSLDKQIQDRTSATVEKSIAGAKAKSHREEKEDKHFTVLQQKAAAIGWDAFKLLDEVNQQALTHAFCSLVTAPMIARSLNIDVKELAQHLTNPTVSVSFGSFVADRLHKAAKATKATRGDKTLNLSQNK